MNNTKLSVIDFTLFKKIIIIFWALWWSIALWTDIVGGLAHLKMLNASWAPDANYPFLVESLKMYSLPEWAAALFFSGIMLWSAVSTIAFWWATLSLHRLPAVWMQRAQVAFIVSLIFWLAFFIADQAVMKFDLEENHMVQGGFELLTLMGVYLLPDHFS